ncbi:hypothetical protein SGPA1_31351 [Streptomyces misionensis JCM 4497]
MRRRLPVGAHADRDVEGGAQVHGVGHLVPDDLLDGGALAGGDLQDDFVVDLEQHPGLQFRGSQRVVHLEHGDLDDVGGRALDRRVEGHALGGLAALAVVAVEVGQIAAAAEEGRRVARGPGLVHRAAQIVPDAAEPLEVGVHQGAGLGRLDVQLLGEAEGGQAVGQAVRHRLDLAAHLRVHGGLRDAEDLGGGGGVQVLTGGERPDQALVLGEVGHHPQLDLAVVGGHQGLEALADDEAAPDGPALVGAHRDVLEVRVRGGQPAGRGHRLVERGVDTAVARDGLDQALDGDAELGLLAVAQHDHRQLVVGLGGEPGQRVGVRGEAGLGLLGLGQGQLAEEDLLELLGRAQVELVARGRVRLLHGLLHRAREHLLHRFQVGAVGGDAVPLHAREQRGGGQLHVAQQVGGADLVQAALEGLAQVQDGAGLDHQGLGLGGLVGAEGQLAVGRGGRRQLAVQVLQRQRVQIEGAAARLDQVGGERGVHAHALDAPAVLGEDPHGALGVVEHLGARRVRQPGRERVLVGLVQLGGVEPGGRSPGRRQGDLGDRAGAQRPGVDGGDAQGPRAVLGEPAGQLAGAQHGAVDLHALGGDRRGLGLGGAGVHGEQALAQRRVADLQGVQDHRDALAVVRQPLQVGDRLGQLHLALQLGQDAVELDRLQMVAEVLARLALDLVDALDQLGEGAELVDPLGGGLLADAGDAGEVVGRVAAQGGEVRVLGGRQAVLLLDLLRGEPGQLRDALGRVQHGGVLADQLEGVAVAGDDQHLEALGLGLGGEGGDDVVRLEALHGEARGVHRVQELADQFDLALELVGALGAVRLVLGEALGAPGLAGDVEGHREVGGRLVTQGVGQHRREAVDRVRRLARRGREVLRGQREERAVGQRVPVHEHQPGTGTAGGLVGLLRCFLCHATDPATPHRQSGPSAFAGRAPRSVTRRHGAARRPGGKGPRQPYPPSPPRGRIPAYTAHAVEGERCDGDEAAQGRSGAGRAAGRGAGARGGGAAGHQTHPAHRPAADGCAAHRADAAAGEPEGRLRLPGLRLAGAGAPAHRGVLRERREGGGRGGHQAPGHPGVLRRAPRGRPGGPQRVLAGPAGSAHPPHVPARGGGALRAGHLGARLRHHRRGDRRARLPGRGGLLHLGPHQQRGGVPVPALRARAGHEQPAGLFEHVPRVLGLGAVGDHRHRQGQRPAGGPVQGRPDHRGGPEPGHQPPAHAVRAGEGQGERREDRQRQPAARGGSGAVQEPADPAGPGQGRRAHRSVPPDPHRRRPGALPAPQQADPGDRGRGRRGVRPRTHPRLRGVRAGRPLRRLGGDADRDRPEPRGDRAGAGDGARLAADHRLLGHGPHPAQALRAHHPRGGQLPAAARQHRPAGGGRVPGARPFERAGRPHHGHLRAPRPRLPGRPGEGVRLRAAPGARVRRRPGDPRAARRRGEGVLRHGRQLRLRLPGHRGDRGGDAAGPADRARVDQAEPFAHGHRRAGADPAHPGPHRARCAGERRAVRDRRGLDGHGARLAWPAGARERPSAVRAGDRVPDGARGARGAERGAVGGVRAGLRGDPRPDRAGDPRLRRLQRAGGPPRRLRAAARAARRAPLPDRHRQGELHRGAGGVPRTARRAAAVADAALARPVQHHDLRPGRPLPGHQGRPPGGAGAPGGRACARVRRGRVRGPGRRVAGRCGAAGARVPGGALPDGPGLRGGVLPGDERAGAAGRDRGHQQHPGQQVGDRTPGGARRRPSGTIGDRLSVRSARDRCTTNGAGPWASSSR